MHWNIINVVESRKEDNYTYRAVLPLLNTFLASQPAYQIQPHTVSSLCIHQNLFLSAQR